MFMPVWFVDGKKALKSKSSRRQARNGKGCCKCGRTGNGTNCYATFCTLFDKSFTRVRYARHTGIGNDCTIFTVFNSRADFISSVKIAEFMIAYHRGVYLKFVEQCLVCLQLIYLQLCGNLFRERKDWFMNQYT